MRRRRLDFRRIASLHSVFSQNRVRSLTCNIAREWRRMMEEARRQPAQSLASGKRGGTMDPGVVYLGEYVRTRRERRLGVGDHGSDAEASNWST